MHLHWQGIDRDRMINTLLTNNTSLDTDLYMYRYHYTNDMRKTLSILLLNLFAITVTSAQVETEAGFLYVKAKYLYDTDRHDDAIREFNKVIKIDPKHEDAMLLRAKSKYALAAYGGAEIDVLEFIKIKGISPEATLVLGQTQYALDDMSAALTTLKSAAALTPSEPTASELLAKIAEKNNDLALACKYYTAATRLGSSTAQEKALQICPEVGEVRPPKVPKTKKEKPMSVGERLTKDDDSTDYDSDDDIVVVADPDLNTDKPIEQVPIEDLNPDETEKLKTKSEEAADNEGKEDTPIAEEVVEEVVEKIDDTPRMLEIDEDLTIKVQGQGLGTREITDQPNILILSESDGVVAIDICVNGKGDVTSATYNQEVSTLDKKSLISLAIRKSKDFKFIKGTDNQCGTLSYVIKGS